MHHYLLVSVEATSVIFMDFWVLCKSMWNLKDYVSSNAKHYVHWIISHFHYLDFQGLVFVVVLVQAVGLMVVVEFEEFVAVVVGITQHPIFLWLHSGLGLTQGHSRPFAEILLWTCCKTGLKHNQ